MQRSLYNTLKLTADSAAGNAKFELCESLEVGDSSTSMICCAHVKHNNVAHNNIHTHTQ
jgi:hypothetical protein